MNGIETIRGPSTVHRTSRVRDRARQSQLANELRQHLIQLRSYLLAATADSALIAIGSSLSRSSDAISTLDRLEASL